MQRMCCWLWSYLFSLPLAWLPGRSGTQSSPSSLQELLQVIEHKKCFHITFRLLAWLGSTQPAAGISHLGDFEHLTKNNLKKLWFLAVFWNATMLEQVALKSSASWLAMSSASPCGMTSYHCWGDLKAKYSEQTENLALKTMPEAHKTEQRGSIISSTTETVITITLRTFFFFTIIEWKQQWKTLQDIFSLLLFWKLSRSLTFDQTSTTNILPVIVQWLFLSIQWNPELISLGLTRKVSFLCKCSTGLYQERRKDALLENDYWEYVGFLTALPYLFYFRPCGGSDLPPQDCDSQSLFLQLLFCCSAC